VSSIHVKRVLRLGEAAPSVGGWPLADVINAASETFTGTHGMRDESHRLRAAASGSFLSRTRHHYAGSSDDGFGPQSLRAAYILCAHSAHEVFD
jgi:hypothetical protein